MPWPPIIPYLIALTASAAVCAVLAFYAWRRRPAPGATSMAWLMLGVAVWALVSALRLGTPDLAAKILWAQVRYLGIVIVPVAWLTFALEYTGRARWLTRRNLLLLAVEPAFTLLLVWTNEIHHLYWSHVELDTSGGFPGWSASYGPWHWIHAGYSYLLLLPGAILLLQAVIRTPRPLLFRRQAGALLVATLTPLIGNVLSTFGWSPFPYVDLTPFGFTVAGLVAAWGLLRFRLLDIVPVARDAIVEGMGDGVIVLDAQGRVVDLNPAAQYITGHTISETIGKPASQVFADRFAAVTHLYEEIEPRTEVILGVGPEQRDFELSTSPLYEPGGRVTGHLVVLHDVADRLYAFRLAQRRVAELDMLNDVGRALTGTLDADELLEIIYHQVQRILNADNLYVALYDEASDIITFALLMHQGQRQPPSQRRAGQGLTEYVIRTRQPLFLRGDVHAQARELGVAPVGSESLIYLSVPLIYGERVMGVLSVQHYEDADAYDESQLRLLQAVANQAAIALHNAQLFKEAETERQTANALAQLAQIVNSTLDQDQVLNLALEQLAQVIAYDSASILLVRGDALTIAACRGFANPERLVGNVISLEENNIGPLVMRAQQARMIPDVQQLAEWGHDRDDIEGAHTIRAWIGAPLVTQGQSIGLLTVDKHEPGFYTEEDKDVAAAFAAQIATAVHNARLYQAVQREHNQLSAILSDATDAVIVVDQDGQVLLVNRAAENTLKVPSEQAIHQPLAALEIEDLTTALLAAQNAAAPVVSEIAAPGGRTLYASVSPVHEVGWVIVMQDITSLKELDRLRSEWVAAVSHDMKNPLATIQMAADMLEETGPLDPAQRSLLGTTRNSAARLRVLVTDVLDLARLEAGLVLQIQTVDLSTAIAEALEEVEPLMAEKRHRLTIDLSPDLPFVRGDAMLLIRALVNLLTNAFKYTPAQGEIVVRAEPRGDHVQVLVIDSGRGIPAEALPHLFSRFYRVPGEEAEGSGLGLSIVKAIVEKHGGQVWVESTPGEGSTFGFTVPRSESKTLQTRLFSHPDPFLDT